MSPPPSVRAITISASPVYLTPSGDTISTCSGMSGVVLELACLGASAVGIAHVEEGLLGQVVELAD